MKAYKKQRGNNGITTVEVIHESDGQPTDKAREKHGILHRTGQPKSEAKTWGILEDWRTGGKMGNCNTNCILATPVFMGYRRYIVRHFVRLRNGAQTRRC